MEPLILQKDCVSKGILKFFQFNFNVLLYFFENKNIFKVVEKILKVLKIISNVLKKVLDALQIFLKYFRKIYQVLNKDM